MQVVATRRRERLAICRSASAKRNRRSGVAKLKLREMGSRYLSIVCYVWLEKYFSRGDYKKRVHSDA